MGFDVAVGASQNQLNGIAAFLYKQLYPALFTGSIPVPALSLAVAYDVRQAPTFDLNPPTSEQRAALAGRAHEAAGELDPRGRSVLSALMDSTVLLSVTAPQIAITLTAADNSKTSLTVSATAVCQADIDPTTGRIQLTTLHVTVSQWTDPTVQWVLDHVIAPQVLTILDQYLAGITLPPLTVAGVTLSPPIVVVQDAMLIALTTLQSSGPPTPPPSGTSWPPANFFALLDTAVVDAAAAYQVAQLNPQFDKSGSASWTVFSVQWGANLTLGSPTIGLGNAFHLSLRLGGGVSAGLSANLVVYKPSIQFGVGFTTNPNPGGSVALGVDPSNRIILSIRQVDSFGIAVQIPGLPSWANDAIGWVTGVVTDGLTSALVPAVNAFIQGLSFSVFTVPVIPVDAGPVHVKVVPTGLSVGPFAGMVATTGALEVMPT